MALNKITFTNSLVKAKNDADLFYLVFNSIGVLKDIGNECSVSSVGNKLVFRQGYVNIYGRQIEVGEGTELTIPLDSVAQGYAIIRVNTITNEIELTYKEAPTYPSLIQNDLQKEAGVYEFALAKYEKSNISLTLQPLSITFIYPRLPDTFDKLEDIDKLLVVGKTGKIVTLSQIELPISTLQKAKNNEYDKLLIKDITKDGNTLTITKLDNSVITFTNSVYDVYTKTESDNKYVQKETGKGLSDNNFTTELMTQITKNQDNISSLELSSAKIYYINTSTPRRFAVKGYYRIIKIPESTTSAYRQETKFTFSIRTYSQDISGPIEAVEAELILADSSVSNQGRAKYITEFGGTSKATNLTGLNPSMVSIENTGGGYVILIIIPYKIQ